MPFKNLERYLSKHPLKRALEKIEIEIYTTDELTEIEKDTRGIYGWYFYPHSVSAPVISGYSSLYRSRSYDVNVTNKLSEEYVGKIGTVNVLLSDEIDNLEYVSDSVLQRFLQVSAIALSPPLYIGRSKDLKNRLKVHRDELNLVLGSLWTTKNIESVDTTAESDTDNESTSFARRIGQYFSENFSEDYNFSISNFLIKTVSFKQLEDPELIKLVDSKFLKDIENYFLKTFHPNLSIR